MTRAFNIEGLVRLQNYMGGKTLSDAQFFAVLNADVKFTSQTLTAEQKTQARTNIGAAEDPNTSGDPQATLEEPPVVDEEPIP